MSYILGANRQKRSTGANWVREVDCTAGAVDTTELLTNIKNHDTYTFDECLSAGMTVDKPEKRAEYDFSLTDIVGIAVVQTMPIDENGEVIRSIEKSPYFTGYILTKARDTIKLNKSATDIILSSWELFKILGAERTETQIFGYNDADGNYFEMEIPANYGLKDLTLDIKKTGKYKQYNTYQVDFFFND